MARNSNLPALFIILVCIGALGSALTAQYAFGLAPCILCYYQRIPYAVVAALVLLSLLPVNGGFQRFLIRLAALAFMVNACIAFYHIGVEQHWWAGLALCSDSGGALPDTPEALLAALSGPPPVPCDQPAWSFRGVTLAGLNFACSIVMTIFCLVASRARKSGWRR